MKFTHKRDVGEANARLCEKARLQWATKVLRHFVRKLNF